MPTETLTTFAKLKKWIKGDPNWHTLINGNSDLIDLFVGQSGLEPNVNSVEVKFVGQRFFQTNAVAWWVGTTIGVPPTGRWTREIPRGLIMAWPLAVAPPGWHVCDGTTVTIDGVDLILQDLRGKYLVGTNSADPEYVVPGPAPGQKTRVVTQANIEQFAIGQPSMRYGGATTLASAGGLSVNSGQNSTNLVVGTVGAAGIDVRPPSFTNTWIAKL